MSIVVTNTSHPLSAYHWLGILLGIIPLNVHYILVRKTKLRKVKELYKYHYQ